MLNSGVCAYAIILAVIANMKYASEVKHNLKVSIESCLGKIGAKEL
jgi:hypothetical protein